jgi:hypothetical protein
MSVPSLARGRVAEDVMPHAACAAPDPRGPFGPLARERSHPRSAAGCDSSFLFLRDAVRMHSTPGPPIAATINDSWRSRAVVRMLVSVLRGPDGTEGTHPQRLTTALWRIAPLGLPPPFPRSPGRIRICPLRDQPDISGAGLVHQSRPPEMSGCVRLFGNAIRSLWLLSEARIRHNTSVGRPPGQDF